VRQRASQVPPSRVRMRLPGPWPLEERDEVAPPEGRPAGLRTAAQSACPVIWRPRRSV